MTYSLETTAISEITGQPVNTWSEEWQRECEARAVLKMSKPERDVFVNGTKDGKRKDHRTRNQLPSQRKAAGDLRPLMQQIMDARAARRKTGANYQPASPL
jgi:hypothetical protein